MRRSRVAVGLLIVGIALIGYFGSRQQNPITGEVQSIALTKSQEIAMGLEAAPQMAEEMGGLEPDRSIQEDVAAVGERVVTRSVAAGSGYQFQFAVLADPQTINAFALPGGPIFITRGLLDRLSNEAELAGVLGHEIGHVLGRHAAEHIAKSQLGEAIVGAIGVAASDDPNDARRAAAVAALVTQVVQLRYGRQDELQADTLGVRLMAEAGYDPRALLGVMQVLEKAGPRGSPEFLSSHPDPGNRELLIRRAIEAHFPDGVPPGLTTGRPIAISSESEPPAGGSAE